MADIELVISIPKNYDLSKIQNGSIASKIILNAVKNGIQLPKGHGNLIDYYDAVELINNKADEENNNFTINDIEKFGALLREVNPIIEADNIESEDKE